MLYNYESCVRVFDERTLLNLNLNVSLLPVTKWKGCPLPHH
jgi:hypothetical protein